MPQFPFIRDIFTDFFFTRCGWTIYSYNNIPQEIFPPNLFISSLKFGKLVPIESESFIFKGPSVVMNICNELSQLVREDGFKNITEAIGIESNK